VTKFSSTPRVTFSCTRYMCNWVDGKCHNGRNPRGPSHRAKGVQSGGTVTGNTSRTSRIWSRSTTWSRITSMRRKATPRSGPRIFCMADCPARIFNFHGVRYCLFVFHDLAPSRNTVHFIRRWYTRLLVASPPYRTQTPYQVNSIGHGGSAVRSAVRGNMCAAGRFRLPVGNRAQEVTWRAHGRVPSLTNPAFLPRRQRQLRNAQPVLRNPRRK
jgi:hypothetical protein